MTTAKKPAKSVKTPAGDRKKLFVEVFLSNGGNATEAAKALGYSEKSAGKQGYRMTKDPVIMALLRQRQGNLAKKYSLTIDSVIGELSKIVHADLRKVFNENGSMKPIADWPDDMAGAIGSVEVEELFGGDGKDRQMIGYTKKVKLWDKNTALEKAMKHLGLFERDNEQSKPVTKVVMVPPKRAKDAADNGS